MQRGAYQLWRFLIALIAVACVVQIFLAGRGAFGLHGSAKLDDQKSFDPHRVLGEIIGLLAVLAFLAALAYWRDKRLIGITFVLAVMAEILQHLFALPKHPWVAGLHALDGITILALSAWLAHQAWRGDRDTATASTPTATAVI
jgi:Mn2+/Fe2+ NRAMP family transporter